MAHAIAPQAKIILYEANTSNLSDLTAVVQAAAVQTGVTAVSMSWGQGQEDVGYDSSFVSPGVTFLASSGDSGSPADYPAYSPNVIAVGGTSLTLNTDNTYQSETAWSGSGGGQSVDESEPSYQLPVQTSNQREAPDVSFDANPQTGVAVCDSYDYGSGTPWIQVGGTSLAAPCWAGLVAIANQLRAAKGLNPLNTASATEAQSILYAIDAADYHDVTSGSNGGYWAGPGYDMVTGLGTPVANKLVPDLALYPNGTVVNHTPTVSLTSSTGTSQFSQSINFAVTVDGVDPGVLPPTGTVTFMDGGTAIGTATLLRGAAVFSYGGLLPGSHAITAVYGGDGTFNTATSAPVSESVTAVAVPTYTYLAASTNSPTYGGPETLTATVGLLSRTATPSGGTVTFTDQTTSTILGTATLTGGTAAITVHSLDAGPQTIVAAYAGDGQDFLGSSASLGVGQVGTLAGNGFSTYGGDGGLAVAAQLGQPFSDVVDAAGDVFIADSGNNVVRKISASTGLIATVAGNGTAGYSGDNGPATAAQLDDPCGLALDASGDLFIADTGNNAVREVNVSTGLISTVAGDGTAGWGGDGDLATQDELNAPHGLALDASGNLYIADTGNDCIRKVNAATQIITTVAGIPQNMGKSGDGSKAIHAQLHSPDGVVVDAGNNLYIADTGNCRIQEVNATHQVITTVAGSGAPGFGGDGQAASSTTVKLDYPTDVAVDSSGDLFIADTGNNRIREVYQTTGTINTVAGNGTAGYSGDGQAATAAQLNGPAGIAVDANGNLFIADTSTNRIRKVNASTQVIGTVAGSVGASSSATAVAMRPAGVAVDAGGDVFIADSGNNVVREISASTGLITVVAGNGVAGYSGDGGQATAAELNAPMGLAVDAAGDLFIADSGNNRIREVSAGTHVITTVAGTGVGLYGGDGGQATAAELNAPAGVALDSAGDLFIADTGNQRIREVAGGTISTVAGNGTAGYAGDGGQATGAELNSPAGVAVDSAGDLYIADTSNQRIRKVAAGTQVISTLSGNGISGYAGDGGLAAAAQLDAPRGLAVDSAGDLFIADQANNCIREVIASSGVMATVAGNGTAGYSGDGGQAVLAELSAPANIAVDAGGNLFIADTGNDRVRKRTGAAQAVNVAPAALTMTANSACKTSGQTLNFAGTELAVSGLVNGDSVTGATLASAARRLRPRRAVIPLRPAPPGQRPGQLHDQLRQRHLDRDLRRHPERAHGRFRADPGRAWRVGNHDTQPQWRHVERGRRLPDQRACHRRRRRGHFEQQWT